MSNQAATAQYIPEGVNRSNRFTVKAVVPGAISSGETFSVTLPDGVPKDALPAAPPNCYSLSGDVYTRDADAADVSTHNRATGVTVYTSGAGGIAAGSIVIQEYIGHG